MRPSRHQKRKPSVAGPRAQQQLLSLPHASPRAAPSSGAACCTLPRLLAAAILLFLLARLAAEARVYLAPLDAAAALPPLATPVPVAAPGAAPAAAAPPLLSLLTSFLPPPAPPPPQAPGALGSTAASPLSALILRADADAAAAHALPREAFNLVLFERASPALAAPDPMCVGAACMGQRFFLVEQQRASSDAILDFLVKSELRVMEVFATVLASESCAGLLPGGAAPWCAHQHALGARARPPPLVLDIGSNSGFYTQLAARAGAAVLAVDPQPHCLQYVRAAAALNGLGARVHTLNAFASGSGVGDAGAGAPARPVRLRTGCWGMFPHDRGLYDTSGEEPHAATREEYDALPGGNASVAVPQVSLPALLAQLGAEAAAGGAGQEGVLLAKVDVEGSELALTRALVASGALAAHTIKNLVLELNKYAAQSEGLACIDAAAPPPMGTAPCFAELLGHFKAAGYAIMVHQPWAGSPIDNVEEFAAGGWRVVDVWLSVPR